MKNREGKSRREEQKRERERVRRETIQARETLCFFEWFVGREGRKVGALKRRVRSHLARWDMNNCNICKSECTKKTPEPEHLEVAMWKNETPLWRQAHFQVKMYKTHHSRRTFGSRHVKKWHAAVVRNTFPSQHVKSMRGPDHFWRCGDPRIAHRCGAKHISKSKFGPHLKG